MEPASTPKKHLPWYSRRFPFFTVCCLWRTVKSSYSFSEANKGSIRLISKFILMPFVRRSIIWVIGVTVVPTFTFIAAPIAANKWECSGAIICSSVRWSVRIKASFNWSRKWSGPPRKATLPRIGLPQARPEIVWLTTAWKIEAAKSSLAAPSLIRGWISVFANTPQRAAIG